jgi:hypothetical protein
MPSPKDIIATAGRMLRDPACFTTGALARTSRGSPVRPKSSTAVKWCAVGAIYHVARADTDTDKHATKVGAALATLDLASNRMFKKSISAVCDELGHEAVMQVYEQAWRGASDEIAREF